MPLVVFPLSPADATAFRMLRMRALREHPEAFASSVEEEESTTVADIAERLRKENAEDCSFGAFIDDRLAGILHLSRSPRVKMRHKAYLGGMYVAPEARGQGAGRALLEAVVAHARTLDDLEEIMLVVTVGNEAARHLYQSVGFESYAIEPHYIRVGETYYDIEWMWLRL